MPLNLQIKRTMDGSDTLFVPELNEHYHSTFGAVQESNHVFVRHGLMAVDPEINPVLVFEVGFGTGLNALLSRLSRRASDHIIEYTAIERYPLGKEIWEQLNYHTVPENSDSPDGPDAAGFYRLLHHAPWEMPVQLDPHFRLTKFNADLCSADLRINPVDLIYFDAFAPDIQPELWTAEVFEKMFRLMKPGGILITYSCKGTVKRNLKAAGFAIEKLPGPPGKREILRARKI